MNRVADIARFFPQALDVGCGRGHVARALSQDLIGSLSQCDMAEHAVVTKGFVVMATETDLIPYLEAWW